MCAILNVELLLLFDDLIERDVFPSTPKTLKCSHYILGTSNTSVEIFVMQHKIYISIQIKSYGCELDYYI